MMKPDMTIKMGPPCFLGISDLDQGEKIDERQIIDICEYIDKRYDCADFRMISIMRTLYSYAHLLSKETTDTMKKTVLGFKYRMDEPGQDGMCYWSENHQILFGAVEYLAGQLYPDDIFTNNGMSGLEHMVKAEKIIMNWLYDRFKYGFIEWHSNVYYEEDVAPLSLLIDLSENDEMVQKCKIIMDILLLDMAIFSWKGLFVASSGRCYEAKKKHPLEQATLQITEKAFGYENIQSYDFSKMSADFLLNKKYDIPDIIREIGRDESEVVAKDSMGLDLSEIKNEFYDLDDMETTGMFLWAMEAFTNKESINISMKMFNEWKLHTNAFLKDLKMINIKVLIKLGLLPFIVRLLNPVTQGIAIQRANTYMYKNKYYALSTAQKHHVKEFADQQHIWQATMSKEITVFTTHPGSAAFSDIDRNFSPDYWVGSGILPHSVQHKNVHMSIYDLCARKGFMEKKRLIFTHAYFPKSEFDEVVHDNQYIFGKAKDAYIALIGKNELVFNPDDDTDLIQQGSLTYWICIMGDIEKDGSFKEFVNAVKDLKVSFDNKKLVLSGKNEYSLAYKKDFIVNGTRVITDYARFETPYGDVERKPEYMRFEYNGKYMYLNFHEQKREYGTV